MRWGHSFLKGSCCFLTWYIISAFKYHIFIYISLSAFSGFICACVSRNSKNLVFFCLSLLSFTLFLCKGLQGMICWYIITVSLMDTKQIQFVTHNLLLYSKWKPQQWSAQSTINIWISPLGQGRLRHLIHTYGSKVITVWCFLFLTIVTMVGPVPASL
jgi:predicted membrane protein